MKKIILFLLVLVSVKSFAQSKVDFKKKLDSLHALSVKISAAVKLSGKTTQELGGIFRRADSTSLKPGVYRTFWSDLTRLRQMAYAMRNTEHYRSMCQTSPRDRALLSEIDSVFNCDTDNGCTADAVIAYTAFINH